MALTLIERVAELSLGMSSPQPLFVLLKNFQSRCLSGPARKEQLLQGIDLRSVVHGLSADKSGRFKAIDKFSGLAP
jgi:hypothetical protein